MTRLRLFAVALGAALLSAAPASPTFGQSPTAAYARLQNLARRMTFVWAKRHPIAATELGLTDLDGELETPSAANRAADLAQIHAWQATLKAIPLKHATLVERDDALLLGAQLISMERAFTQYRGDEKDYTGHARAIVDACLYAPLGHRSAFGSGPQLGYAAIPQAEVCKIINDETLLMAMIETPEAVANADAIATVEGIHVLHIGASDLSTEMGIPGQYKHERMRAAFETVAKAAKRHGKAMGVGGVRQDFEFQSWLIGIGMRYLTGGSDVGYILSAGRADVKQLRELKL